MTFSRIVSAVALALAIGQGTPPATPPAQASTALIAGQVLDATTNRPVADMVVTLTLAGATSTTPGAAAAGRKVLTDGSGRFVFSNLVAGRYSVTAVRAGYVAGAVGKLAVRGGGAPLQLANGERVTDARILVWKHGAIRGGVTDEAGEAVVDARVTVRRRTMIAGRPGYMDAAYATTDDRGEYRIGGLEPAAYVVGVFATSTTLPLATVEAYDAASGQARTDLQRALFAAAPTMTGLGTTANAVVDDYIFQVDGRLVAPPDVSREGGMRIYPTSFHGGTSAVSEAQVVVVTAGEQRAGIDIPLRLSRVYRLTGTIAAADGPGRPTPLLLWPVSQQDAQPSQAVASTVSDPGGTFTFLAVPPGQYLLRAMNEQPAQSGGAGSNSMLWGEAPVVIVDRDVTTTLTLQSGFRVAGRFVIEGEGALPMNRIFVNLESIDRTRFFGEFSETLIAPDGTFRSAPAPGGRYRLTVPVPSGWFVKSVVSSGRSLDDLPIDLKESLTDLVITVSNRGAQVSGTVRNSNGTIDATATVILFPADPRQWVDFSAYSRGIKDVRTARDGAYVVADLPEGDYLVIALPQQQVDWSQPRFFEVLSRLATRVTLGSGEGRRLDLVTGSVKW